MLRFQCFPSCLSKVPENGPLSGSPKGVLMERVARFHRILYKPLKFLIKVLLIKEMLPLSRRPLERSAPPLFYKTGSLSKQTPISTALLSISFGVPSREALPPGSPHKAPTGTDAPFPEPSYIHLSKSR